MVVDQILIQELARFLGYSIIVQEFVRPINNEDIVFRHSNRRSAVLGALTAKTCMNAFQEKTSVFATTLNCTVVAAH